MTINGNFIMLQVDFVLHFVLHEKKNLISKVSSAYKALVVSTAFR